MTGQQVSHYRIEEPLGRGGMGEVYAAEDLRLGRKVAIKFLPAEACCEPEAVERFLREARAISSLNHPHICTLHDIGEHDGQQFMVMELLEGKTLKARVTRGPLPLDDVLLYGEQIADALDAAHGKGIIHRDLKPANLFVTRRAQVKVLDFGIAKLAEPGRTIGSDDTIGSDQLTALGSAVGTIHYMSPEQARGLEIDARSDLFSLGIVLYEMATGHPAFSGPTPAVVFEGILGGVPRPPSEVAAGVPADLDRIILRALEKDREIRYQSAADLRADLKRLRKATESGRTMSPAVALPSAGSGPSAVSGSVTPTVAAAPPAASFKRWALAAPLVTLAIIAGVLYWRSAQTPALAHRDTVVLASLVNRTGDSMFDDTLSEALAVQLRQSPFLNVLNDQQQQATLRLMGRDPMAPVTGEVGRELCQRAGAKALLGGTIASLGSAYVITLNAQDCVNGEVLAEEQVQAPGKEEVLRVLGEGVSQFRERLGESLASIKRYDAPVEQASTSSLEALKAYSQGTVVRRTEGDIASMPFFKRAIELDPDFALAHARLGTVYSNISEPDAARESASKAYSLRERVSDRERFYIEARYHTTVTEDFDKAIETYRLLLATYPDDFAAHTNLGALLRRQGKLNEAIPILEAATKLAPDQLNPFLNLGYALSDVQRTADARRAFERAIALQDSSGARAGLFGLAILTGDDALAQAQVEAVRGRRDELNMTGVRIQAAWFTGRVSEARALSAEWVNRMEQDGRRPGIGSPLMGGLFSEVLTGHHAEAARAFADAGRRGYLTQETTDEQLYYAALRGDAALARKVYPAALREVSGGPTAAAETKRAFQAMLALAEGRPAAAFELLDPPSLDSGHLQSTLLWTIAARRANRTADALRGLEYLLSVPSRLGLDAVPPWLTVEYARALASDGRVADARRQYQAFFDRWKNADADVPLLVQARSEFEKLGT